MNTIYLHNKWCSLARYSFVSSAKILMQAGHKTWAIGWEGHLCIINNTVTLNKLAAPTISGELCFCERMYMYKLKPHMPCLLPTLPVEPFSLTANGLSCTYNVHIAEPPGSSFHPRIKVHVGPHHQPPSLQVNITT